jgi:hypothetical protein
MVYREGIVRVMKNNGMIFLKLWKDAFFEIPQKVRVDEYPW